MKRITVLFLSAILCLCLAACTGEPESVDSLQDSPQRSKPVQTEEEPVQQNIELIGPWHLDSEKNDLDAFADSLDLFPGYGEWGASMEIRSNGQMGWYIGAEGWYGTYTLEDDVVYAELTSESEQSTKPWDFRITEEGETAMLEMDYEDMTIYWTYGDQ